MENFTRDHFDSWELLSAVDRLDNIRYVLADKDDMGPPQARRDLMELHQLVFDAVRYSGKHDREKILELLEDVQDVVREVLENAESISDSLIDLWGALTKHEEE